LLAWFPPDEPTIAALLAVDGDHAVRASANLALAHLAVPAAAIAAEMTTLLDHPSFLVRVTAAIALAYRLGHGLPDPALTILIEAKGEDALPDFPLGWQHRAARGYVALALQRLRLPFPECDHSVRMVVNVIDRVSLAVRDIQPFV
jgi:HEAT repeat protein